MLDSWTSFQFLHPQVNFISATRRTSEGSEHLCLPEQGEGTYSRELVASLLHPSYVSYETVLSRVGVIPEWVTLLKSSCMKRGKVFDNATGSYKYIHVPETYFPIALT